MEIRRGSVSVWLSAKNCLLEIFPAKYQGKKRRSKRTNHSWTVLPASPPPSHRRVHSCHRPIIPLIHPFINPQHHTSKPRNPYSRYFNSHHSLAHIPLVHLRTFTFYHIIPFNPISRFSQFSISFPSPESSV